jgi:uncharacterized protein (TIGR01777 family)
MKILMTGATGLVGKKLLNQIIHLGYQVNVLTRDIAKGSKILSHPNVQYYPWPDCSKLPPIDAFLNIDGIINLMGENIGNSRWSENQKILLKKSRIDSTKALVSRVLETVPQLSFFISASAIGIYPVNLPETLNENSINGTGFLSTLCQDWEKATDGLPAHTRKIIFRTSVVLDSNGGALAKMLPPFKMGVGGIIGNGRQMMSWIHIEDLISLYLLAIKDQNINGIYNACSPNPVSNKEFTKALGSALHRPTLFPVPTIALNVLFGEMSSIILDSQAVVSTKLNTDIYKFKYSNISEALKSLFN